MTAEDRRRKSQFLLASELPPCARATRAKMLGRRAVVDLQLQQSPLLDHALGCNRSRRQLRISRPTGRRLGITRPLSFEIGARRRAKLTGAVVVSCPGNQDGDGQVGPRCCRSDLASSQASNCPQAYTQALWPEPVIVRLQATSGARSHPGVISPRRLGLALRYPWAANFSSQTGPRACRMRPRGTPAAVGASGPLAGCRRARVRCRV